MSQQIALDSLTNDLILLEDGGIARVTDGRWVVQLVKSKLQTALGEWALDPRVGWLNRFDSTKSPDLFDLEFRAREVILSVAGVQSIDTMTLELEKSRTLFLTFTATTKYGGIDLTIPWGI